MQEESLESSPFQVHPDRERCKIFQGRPSTTDFERSEACHAYYFPEISLKSGFWKTRAVNVCIDEIVDSDLKVL